MDSLDDDYNETETREFITDALKAKGWKLGFNMRYEYKITDGRVQIDEDDDSFRDEALFADYLLFAPYTSITTNILFFDNKKPTKDLWIYRMDMPEDLKHFSKTKLITDEHMEIVKAWWNNRIEITEEGNEKARCFKNQKLLQTAIILTFVNIQKRKKKFLV